MMESGWAWIVTDGTTVSSDRILGVNVTAVVTNVSKIIDFYKIQTASIYHI